MAGTLQVLNLKPYTCENWRPSVPSIPISLSPSPIQISSINRGNGDSSHRLNSHNPNRLRVREGLAPLRPPLTTSPPNSPLRARLSMHIVPRIASPSPIPLLHPGLSSLPIEPALRHAVSGFLSSFPRVLFTSQCRRCSESLLGEAETGRLGFRSRASGSKEINCGFWKW